MNTLCSGPVTEDTVSSLRQRLNAMKEALGDHSDSDAEDAKGHNAKANKRKKNCMDTLIDGSFMGMVLGVCLVIVLGASFFAFKNLYFAVMRKWYPEKDF